MKSRRADVERLIAYVFDGAAAVSGEDFAPVFEGWLAGSGRFLAFVDAHRDKIRKKLRTAADFDMRGDVRAELETAFLLLADRRIDLAFEAYGRERRGPDFTVTFRAAHRFNLEVTRPRARNGDTDHGTAIANAVLGKLRQFPVETANALVVATGLAASAEEVASSMRALKLHASRREEEVFAARGLSTADFQRHYRRLAVLFVVGSDRPGVHAWTNPEATRILPRGATAACVTALSSAAWGAGE